MLPPPGVSLRVPSSADASGPIPLDVTMVASMPVYYANDGILDKALNVVLVRRDAPGVRFLAKIDPQALMLPDPPLPPPRVDPMKDPSVVREERTLDPLQYGVTHEGAADYHVFATFANWLTEPEPLTVQHLRCSLPVGPHGHAPSPAPNMQGALPPVPSRRGVVARMSTQGGLRVEGALRTALPSPRFQGEPVSPPFVTLVAIRLAPTGGVAAGSFVVDAREEGPDRVAQFSIPLAQLGTWLQPGTYHVLVFSGDERAAPLSVTIP
jgi:hypothetical protein